MAKRIRLDLLLVNKGLLPNRSKSRDSIVRGTVFVDGKRVSKPGQIVPENANLELNDPARDYVSRSALKLVAGLDNFNLNPVECVCLDIGASTGGFTQVLLERGAKLVYSLDVGHGQLHEMLGSDSRVVSMEGVNSRNITANHFEQSPEFLVCDVSFISLKLAIEPALEIAAPGSQGLFLVKPQFEVGRKNVGKGGIVSMEAAEIESNRISSWLDQREGWRSIGLVKSPILGSDGNQEYLLAAERTAGN